MSLNQLLFVLLIGTFVSYVFYIAIKFGIQRSISQSYYVLPNKQKILFTLFIWGISLPIIVIGATPLMFFSGGMMMFVGAATSFKDGKLTFNVHMTSAFGGIILSQVSTIVDFNMWYLTLLFGIISLILFLLKVKYFWWIEMLAFISIIITLGANRL
jgi:hypothetical protein